MMRLPAFRYRAAKTAEEAAAILAGEGPGARVVAGGTDLFPNLKRRHQRATTVIGLRGARGLRGVRDGNGSGAVVGAMTTLSEIAGSAALGARWRGFVEAVRSISTPILRNMGTIGGNLCLDTRCTYYNQDEEWRESISYCLKEAGQVCWVAPGSPRCWAVSSSDAAPALCALGASVRLVSREGERVIPVADLFRDDGIDYLTKRPDEVLTDVRLPAPAGGVRSTYWKLRRRGSIDFPVLGVAAAVGLDARGTVASASIWLSGVGSAPMEARAAAEFLVGKPPTPEIVAEAARLARDPATPLDNTDFTLQWRKQMVERWVEGALRELAGLPAEERY
jgi:4-hydroxybenzoyl-CoA reductase subunit beta